MRTRSNSSSARGAASRRETPLVPHDRLGDLLADRDRPDRARAGLLEDHRHDRPAHRARARRRQRQHVAAVDLGSSPPIRARFGGMQPHQRAQRHALAGAGFAEQRQHLAASPASRSTPLTARTGFAPAERSRRSGPFTSTSDVGVLMRRCLRPAGGACGWPEPGLRHEAGGCDDPARSRRAAARSPSRPPRRTCSACGSGSRAAG